MSAPAVRRLGEVRPADASEVGGKAASLGELLAVGVRVPDGVVLTAAVADMTPDDRHSLVGQAVVELGAGPFAVRSSGIAEDGAERSFAGMYETILDASQDEVPNAVERCLASARAPRVAAYQPTSAGMAVIVQHMVAPVAAGVALTADPISGDRGTAVVTAVRGVGERLVVGTAVGDEWIVREGTASGRRQPEGAIDERQALAVAEAARRIAARRGTPQDIEWAIDAAGTLWVLQARPMTALPPDVSWDAPAPGAYTRQYRFGEWISEPVTPLFESWLLTAMEDRLHAQLREWIGQRAPRPYHVVVNGWYFYSLNFISPGAVARTLPGLLWRLATSPRRLGLIPPLLRHSFPLFEREWREDLLPRYRAAVAAAEDRVEDVPVVELPGLVDELADLAGEYFASIAALAGSASKLELMLAGFHRRHLRGLPGTGHLTLLAGFEPPAEPPPHAVVSLDWWHAPRRPSDQPARPLGDHGRLVEARLAAEEAAYEALASSPGRLRTFRRLLVDAQHLVLVREEQVSDLTLAWPVMRRAVLRIGEHLATTGRVEDAEDVFFLTHEEALAFLRGGTPRPAADILARRSRRTEQGRLVPPLLIGRPNRVLRRMWDSIPILLGADPSSDSLVSGAPAAAGRAAGPVRVIRGPQDFDELQVGEILVAPLTAPAWTPLFTRAAAVVTDGGSAASHASIIAREYGIPAVVGCGDATARLRTGMRVTVDGGTGNVEPE